LGEVPFMPTFHALPASNSSNKERPFLNRRFLLLLDINRNRKSRLESPEVCPVCGEDVPRHSLACPDCGADHNSGWRTDAADGLDLPDEDFDYDEFVRREFSSGPKPAGMKMIWWITAIVLLAICIAVFILRS
jgi:hypothetical protein